MFSPITKREGKEILYSLDSEESTFLFPLTRKTEKRGEVTCPYSIPSLQCPQLMDKRASKEHCPGSGIFCILTAIPSALDLPAWDKGSKTWMEIGAGKVRDYPTIPADS